MIAALAVAWRWFLGTMIGRWIVGIGAVLAAVAALAAVAFLKGRHAQADADKAKDAKQQADAERVAQQVQTDAAKAAEQVQKDAEKRPAPDTVKRDDFDNTSL